MTRFKSTTTFRLRKWYVITSLLIITAAVVIKVQAVSLPNGSSIPSQAIPSPNAYHTFMSTVPMEKDINVINWAVTKPRTDQPTSLDHPSDPANGWHVFTWAEKAHLLAENQPVISIVRQGLAQSYVNPRSNYYVPDESDTYFSSHIQNLLILQSQVQAHQNDWSSAINSCMDTIEIGSMLPHGGGLLELSFGLSTERYGRAHVQAEGLIDHLNSNQAKSAAQRLAAINSGEQPFSDSLQEEAWRTEAGMLDEFSNPNWRRDFNGNFGNNLYVDLQPVNLRQAFYVDSISPSHYYNEYASYMNQRVADSKLPWPDQIKQAAPIIPSDMPGLGDILAGDTTESLAPYCNLALNRLLEVQLALRAYHLDHGIYPADLNKLTPAYIPAVPIDPFSQHQPLKYRLTSNGYVLYSIGADAVDNGGKPIDNTGVFGHSHMNEREIREASLNINAKGDIVAGVNE